MITGTFLSGTRQTIVIDGSSEITVIEMPAGPVTVKTIPKGQIQVIDVQTSGRRKRA